MRSHRFTNTESICGLTPLPLRAFPSRSTRRRSMTRIQRSRPSGAIWCASTPAAKTGIASAEPRSRRARLPPAAAGGTIVAMSIAAEKDTVAGGFAERIRELEHASLWPLAARSYPARRARSEEDCALRTPFQRDRDRIVHCKAFRRLTHKTQVFVAPSGDHYRTRLTHTLEVTQVSRTVARALGLHEDLTEPIGLGHDLAHPPFGHVGEAALDGCLQERFGTGFR